MYQQSTTTYSYPWRLSMLLKQFEEAAVRETFHDVVDIEDFLERYRRSPIEFLGSGLYHPVYPLIPFSDWDAQTARARQARGGQAGPGA